MMSTRANVVLLFLSIALAVGCDGPTIPTADEAIVVFAFQGYPADTLRVLVRHAPTIKEARKFIAGRSSANIPSGPIVRGTGVDPRYPFHFIPDSVRLASVTIELCDGAPMRTSAEVDTFMEGATGDSTATSAQWCPWSARPIAIE